MKKEIEKKRSDILYEVECLQMLMEHETDPAAVRRLTWDIKTLMRERDAMNEIELLRTLPKLQAATDRAAMTESEIRREAAGIVTRFESQRDVAIFALNVLGMSVRKISAKLNISVGSVSAALKRIEAMGVRVYRHKGGGGTHTGNAYRHNGHRRDRTHNPAVEQ